VLSNATEALSCHPLMAIAHWRKTMMIIPIGEGGLIVRVGNHSSYKGHNLKLNGSQTQITHPTPPPPPPPPIKERTHTKDYLNKLYRYNITTLAQIQNLEKTAIIFSSIKISNVNTLAIPKH